MPQQPHHDIIWPSLTVITTMPSVRKEEGGTQTAELEHRVYLGTLFAGCKSRSRRTERRWPQDGAGPVSCLLRRSRIPWRRRLRGGGRHARRCIRDPCLAHSTENHFAGSLDPPLHHYFTSTDQYVTRYIESIKIKRNWARGWRHPLCASRTLSSRWR